ncbi:adenine phosphoribosyltransferase [Aliidiomarina halalkaliphila]|uniref:Adenine phosphoribosyltransferase n=1 Tax=Aliidiomarina halalkaliphila TaxID=2593535 RepID=A0A552X577_9GAMM|nr:adenine phosphoribosyltransferase [Aliidiomarina halalkaliphila]TRW50119.1 adenine phosphoribosyltransferase [Aliidiomarina halalkaliphila]
MTHYVAADMRSNHIARRIMPVENFPQPGIRFRDITPALQDPRALRNSIDLFAERYENAGLTQIVAIEARGFIFSAALADRLGIGLTLIRKPGKLPRDVFSTSYMLEYGDDVLELHKDALKARDKVIIMDDMLATGGTMGAAVELVRKTPATIYETAFVCELLYLNGRKALDKIGVNSYAICAFDE